MKSYAEETLQIKAIMIISRRECDENGWEMLKLRRKHVEQIVQNWFSLFNVKYANFSDVLVAVVVVVD